MATMRFLFGSVGSSGPTRPADAGPKCRSALLASRLPKPIGRPSTNTTRETSIGAPAEARINHDRRPMGRQPQHRRDLGPYVGLFGNSLDLAIQSLDSLNDQIVQFIFTPKASEFDVDADNDCMQPKQREALKSSMALMRRLLLDAQAKFRKMVEDNKQLATRIDGDIQAAHEEVSELRTELADTNRRINELTTSPILAITDGTALRCSRCLNCSHQDDNQVADEVSQLRAESEKLAQQNRSLQREVEELRRLKEHMLTEDNNVKPQIEKLETDLQHAREALLALKADRKRLKAEKFDLLNQMKQLYGTLEDKERELRDFIRNYEQRMKESDESLKQMGKTTTPRDPEAPKLAAEREETEREKWSLLKHARDEAERSVALCAQLGVKETQLKQVQEELAEARKQLSQLGYYSDQDSLTSKTNGFHTPTTTPINTPSERDAQTPSNTMATAIVPNEGALPPDTTPSITVDAADSEGSPIYAAMSVCSENPSMYHGLSRSAEELTHMLSTLDLKKKSHRRNNSKSTWGSISRVFSRSRSRRSIDASFFDDDKRTSWSPHTSLCASPLVEESYSEKLRLLEEAQGVPMEQWRASTVLAWLELSLGMPQYAPLCAENVKSGKILLELTDAELEAGLGIINPMHRRKLRLAIEEHRDPSSIKYPKLGELTHMWACGEWLTSIGLSQYIDTFAAHLVDGRMLENLTRKDLEKYLGVTRKFHQASILHGIHLLRMMCYDKQLIAERRAQCENCDSDTLVWTNQRFLKWARSIDLGEYADNLKDSGVHGALVVLEPSFTADTMAAALGIPQSKNIIRRHLMTELEAIVQPARYVLEQEVSQGKSRGKRDKTPMGSIGRSFSRSYAGGLQSTKTLDSRRSSLRGSLTRALGLKMKQDMQNATPSGPRSPQPSQSNALVETHRRVKSSGDIETVTITPV